MKDRAILMLAVGQTLVWAGLFYLFPASLLRWEADLGWSKPELTLGITIAVFVSALAAPIAGRIIDGGHGPKQMGLSAIFGGICVLGLSQMVALWQFYALAMLIGVCLAGCLYEPCFAMVTRARGDGAKQGIILITLVAGFAGTISFPAVHFLSELMGWRGATAAMGVCIGFVVAPLLWRGALDLGAPHFVSEDATKPSPVGFLRTPAYWLLGFAFALAAMVHGASLHHLLPILAERGVSLGTAVFVAACIGPMQVVGRLGMVTTQHWFSSHVFALIAFLFMAGSATVLLFADTSPILLGLFVLLFGSAYGTVSILRPVIAREILGGENFGTKSGGLALMYLAASASSAYIGALIWAIGGYDLMLIVLIVLACLGAALYAATRILVNRLN